MNFVFTEKKMSSSDDLRAYAEKKIGKLEKLFRGESTAYVTFRVERNRNIAEVTVNANGMFYRASESTNDMYVSIDAAVAALTRQVRKYKTRLEKRIHENVLEADFAAAVPVQEEEDDGEKMSLFYLLQHYSKENAEIYKKQKEKETKEGKIMRR